MKGTMLVPIDGSEHSLRALDVAVDLARGMGLSLELCAVIDTARLARLSFGEPQLEGGAYDALNDEAEQDLARATVRTRTFNLNVGAFVRYGDPATEIETEAARCGAVMIVMGTHGRTGLGHLLLGSVAEGVMRRATVPVVVVPPEHREAASETRTVA